MHNTWENMMYVAEFVASNKRVLLLNLIKQHWNETANTPRELHVNFILCTLEIPNARQSVLESKLQSAPAVKYRGASIAYAEA